MIKIPKKLGIEGSYLNTVMAIDDKPIANLILIGGKPQSISSKIKNETNRCTLSIFIQHSA
jgi:hypothetical protein